MTILWMESVTLRSFLATPQTVTQMAILPTATVNGKPWVDTICFSATQTSNSAAGHQCVRSCGTQITAAIAAYAALTTVKVQRLPWPLGPSL